MRVLVTAVGFAYPLRVYAGLPRFEPRVLIAVAAAGLLAHAAWRWHRWDWLDALFRRVFPPSAAGGGH